MLKHASAPFTDIIETLKSNIYKRTCKFKVSYYHRIFSIFITFTNTCNKQLTTILLKFNSEFHCKFQLWILYTKILIDPTLLSISEEHGVGKQRCFASLDNIHCFCPSVPYLAM